MLLFVLPYLGGVLTILSPCILPVIPFVLARADRPFLRNGLPMLVGMTLAFAVVATLASVAGGWVVSANQYGRIAALALLAIFGVTLLLPELADRLMRPLVAVGARLSQSADHAAEGSVWAPLLLGTATGFLWAPCAGPILGLILTGAALEGASVKTTLLLLTYAAGAATSLALLIGGRVFAAMKRSIGAGEWLRRGFGSSGTGGDCGNRTWFRHRLSHQGVGREHDSPRRGPARQIAPPGKYGGDDRWSVDDAGQAGWTRRGIGG
jgi:cytochrome c biogenesis protein CcdA